MDGHIAYGLGDRVTVTHRLVRVCGIDGKRTWSAEALPEPVTGIITGRRTLNNGRVIPGCAPTVTFDSWDYGESPEWKHEGNQPAWLVTTDLRRKPLPVAPEHVNPANSEA